LEKYVKFYITGSVFKSCNESNYQGAVCHWTYVFQNDAFVNANNLSRNKLLRPLVVYAANNDKVQQTHHLFFIIDWLTGQSWVRKNITNQ